MQTPTLTKITQEQFDADMARLKNNDPDLIELNYSACEIDGVIIM